MRVFEKKWPSENHPDKFFVSGPVGVKAMLPVGRYGDVWPEDAIEWPDSQIEVRQRWVNRADGNQQLQLPAFKVHPAQVQAEEVVLEMTYVSALRRLGHEWYYLAQVGTEHLSFSGQVVQEFFGGGFGHYATLGVSSQAKAHEIKAAYKAQAKRKHPDAGGSPQEFRELQEAYEVLNDPQERARYDAQVAHGHQLDRQPPHWPGNGHGLLTATAERRGGLWRVLEIHTFARTQRGHSRQLSWDEVEFTNAGVSVRDVETMRLYHFAASDLPFRPSGSLELNKASFGEPPTLGVAKMATGAWQREPSWEEVEAILTWPPETVDAIKERGQASPPSLVSAYRAVLQREGILTTRMAQAIADAEGERLWYPALQALGKEWGHKRVIVRPRHALGANKSFVYRYDNDVVGLAYDVGKEEITMGFFLLPENMTVGQLARMVSLRDLNDFDLGLAEGPGYVGSVTSANKTVTEFEQEVKALVALAGDW